MTWCGPEETAQARGAAGCRSGAERGLVLGLAWQAYGQAKKTYKL